MTRALVALCHGDLRMSLSTHPLALPTLLAQIALAVVSVYLTLRDGHPFDMWKGRMRGIRLGRATILANALVFVLVFALWGLREAGLFGGPVFVE